VNDPEELFSNAGQRGIAIMTTVAGSVTTLLKKRSL
jgi:hypothetical protein